MNTINIDGRVVGDKQPVFIIAEACDNHFGNLETAKEMARQAKLAGADCIKYQHHLADEEMLPDVPMSQNFDIPLYEFLQRYALSLDQHRELKDYCEQIDIMYLCTPFSYKAALELASIGVAAYKIGSGEMTDLVSLEGIAALGKPMIVSTGMSTLPEITDTYRALKSWGVEFALMNCVSEYPPDYGDINLGVISRLKAEFPDTVIGHSDHTPDIYTCFAAVALGAGIIEKHIILDKSMPGPDQSVSIEIDELAELVDGIRKIEIALGSERKVHDKEVAIRTWAFRSIVTVCDIEKGTVISREMLCTKRPGTGIPSKEIATVIGRKAGRSIPQNTLLGRDDLE